MKLTSSQIKKYNKIADAGKKPIMVRVGSKWYTWYEGDPKYGVFLTTQSGKDVEFDFKQIDDIQENKMEKMKSKLREIIREEIKSLKEMKELNLSDPDIDIFISGNKIEIDFDMFDFKASAIQRWVKGKNDRVGKPIDDLLEKHKLRLDWDKKVKMPHKHAVQMFVKRL